jgi:hypothetical protein
MIKAVDLLDGGNGSVEFLLFLLGPDSDKSI